GGGFLRSHTHAERPGDPGHQRKTHKGRRAGHKAPVPARLPETSAIGPTPPEPSRRKRRAHSHTLKTTLPTRLRTERTPEPAHIKTRNRTGPQKPSQNPSPKAKARNATAHTNQRQHIAPFTGKIVPPLAGNRSNKDTGLPLTIFASYLDALSRP
ncbi:hypothetical protein, partial [Aureimonas populi]